MSERQLATKSYNGAAPKRSAPAPKPAPADDDHARIAADTTIKLAQRILFRRSDRRGSARLRAISIYRRAVGLVRSDDRQGRADHVPGRARQGRRRLASGHRDRRRLRRRLGRAVLHRSDRRATLAARARHRERQDRQRDRARQWQGRGTSNGWRRACTSRHPAADHETDRVRLEDDRRPRAFRRKQGARARSAQDVCDRSVPSAERDGRDRRCRDPTRHSRRPAHADRRRARRTSRSRPRVLGRRSQLLGAGESVDPGHERRARARRPDCRGCRDEDGTARDGLEAPRWRAPPRRIPTCSPA